MDNAVKKANNIISKYPLLKMDVLELVSMMREEIYSGESIDNEIELFYSSLSELVNKYKMEIKWEKKKNYMNVDIVTRKKWKLKDKYVKFVQNYLENMYLI